MYTPYEPEALEKRNYHRIREMIRVTYTVGYNIRKPRRFDWALRLFVWDNWGYQFKLYLTFSWLLSAGVLFYSPPASPPSTATGSSSFATCRTFHASLRLSIFPDLLSSYRFFSFADHLHVLPVLDGRNKTHLLSYCSSQVLRVVAPRLSPWVATAVRSISSGCWSGIIYSTLRTVLFINPLMPCRSAYCWITAPASWDHHESLLAQHTSPVVVLFVHLHCYCLQLLHHFVCHKFLSLLHSAPWQLRGYTA